MSTFATGGKVWSLPSSNHIPLKKRVTLLEVYAKFSLVIYIATGISLIASGLVSLLIKIAITAPVETMNTSNSGFIIPAVPKPLISPELMWGITLGAPLIIAAIVLVLEHLPIQEKLRETISVISLLGFFGAILVNAFFVMSSTTNIINPPPSTSQVISWMQSRYDFTPYNPPAINDIINGKVLYPDDPSSSIREAYLKENNGAYYLVDSAGKELSTK